jgi:hypothetical protein
MYFEALYSRTSQEMHRYLDRIEFSLFSVSFPTTVYMTYGLLIIVKPSIRSIDLEALAYAAVTM